MGWKLRVGLERGALTLTLTLALSRGERESDSEGGPGLGVQTNPAPFLPWGKTPIENSVRLRDHPFGQLPVTAMIFSRVETSGSLIPLHLG